MTDTKSELSQLKTWTTVVADTGDIDEIARVRPTEATTNPSLILKAAMTPRGEAVLREARRAPESASDRIDRVLTAFGAEILRHIPGRVSTEVDARLSFNPRAASLRFMKRSAFHANGFSSRLPARGKAHRLRACWSLKAFTAT